MTTIAPRVSTVNGGVNGDKEQYGMTEVITSAGAAPVERNMLSRTYSLDNMKEGGQRTRDKQALSADGGKRKPKNDGRKIKTGQVYHQSDGMLPPLDGRQYSFLRERTFMYGSRQGLNNWGTPGSVQQIQDQHWNPRPRPIREDVSKKIVHHLKKQFMRRIDRRFTDMFDEDDMYDEVEQIKAELGPEKPHVWSRDQGKHEDHGYWKYQREQEDDKVATIPVGRRITPIQTSSRPASKGDVRFNSTSTPTNKSALDKLSVALARPARDNEAMMFPEIETYSMPSTGENGSMDMKTSPVKPPDSRQGLRSRGPTLPSINDQEFSQSDQERSLLNDSNTQDHDDSIEGTGNFLTKGGIEYLSASAKKKKVFDMTGLDTRENTEFAKTDEVVDSEITSLLNKLAEENMNVDFQNVVVSPVPTPYIFSRPQTTRTARKMSEMEKLIKVMKGQVHVKVKPKSKLLKIYIHSCGTDTETERSYLLESVYPSLRHQCKMMGYDLEMVDLLWGVDGMVLDDHCWMHLANKIINDCYAISKGIAALTFTSQKYGNLSLPATLTREEIDSILLEMETEYNTIIQDLEAKVLYIPQSPSILSKQGTSLLSVSRTGKSQDKKGKRPSVASLVSNKSQQSRESTLVRSSTVLSPSGSANPVDEHQQQAEEAAYQRAEFVRKMDEVKQGKYSLKMLASEHGMTEDEHFPDINFVKSWYTLDNNAIPAVYTLNNVSSHFPDISARDRHSRTEAQRLWKGTSQRLAGLLHHFVHRAGCSSYTLSKFTTSDLESQLTDGIFDHATPSSCLWIQRELLDIRHSLDDGKARDYLDLNESGRAIDKTAELALKRLVSVMQNKISPSNIMRYTIQWNNQGVCPEKVRTHSSYIHHLCKDIYGKVMTALTGSREGEDDDLQLHLKVISTELVEEVKAHTSFCQSRAYSFYGRKDILNSIKKYVRSSCNRPLVVYGKPGCGKTSLLAKAAVDVHKWLKDQTVCVVQRAIGETVSSVNVRLLLHLLSQQLSYIHNQDSSSVPQDYKTLSNQFQDRLSLASEDRPIVLFIDSLHHLTDEHDARKLSWLPKELPAHVKLIVSTDPDEKYDCLPQLQKALPKGNELFLEIDVVSHKDAKVILQEWYSRSDRLITNQQHVFILDSFKKCPQPLYLKMLYNESLKWSSSFDTDSLKLSPVIRIMTSILYGNLEKRHGEPLVKRAIGYIAASKNGISSSEMEDVLSLDEAVMSDVLMHTKLQRRRLPPLFWIRLKEDLSQYIEETNTDNTVTFRFRHMQFYEAAVDRYLNSRDKAPSYHKALAEYFLNLWYERPKPCAGNDTGLQRYIMNQELYTELDEDDNTERKDEHDEVDGEKHECATKIKERYYNLRRLSELPFHLLKSSQNEVLKRMCLCNFEFAWGKITAFSLRAFFEDIQMALSVEANDKDLHLLSDSLFLAQSTLNIDTTQFPSQMVGRLYEVITKDLPVAPQDPVNYPFLKPFLKGARSPSKPSIIPSMTCLTPPGGILFDLLSGHTEEITAVCITNDSQYVLTASLDNTMKIWEMRTGRVVKTVTGVGKDVTQIRIGLEGKLIITAEHECVRIWDRNTGGCVTKYKMDDPCSVAVTGDSKTIAAFTHGTNTMFSWDLESLKMLAKECVRDSSMSTIHQDESIVVAMQGIGPLVLYAFRSYYEATVRHAKTGAVVYTLKCKDGASIQGLACTSQYFICAARYRYQNEYEVYFLEVFDASNGKLMRSVRGCVDDDIKELVVNQIGSHAIAICSSEASNTSNIAVWNIETQDHKHIASHAKVSTICACTDLRNAITTTKDETSVRMWNLQALVNKSTPKQKSTEGIIGFIPDKSNERYVIAKSTRFGNLTLWDGVSGKCVDKSIKISGLQKHDVVIMTDTRAVILSDKTSNEDDSSSVFQTILIYDIKKKEYITQIKDCFIFQCPENEYVLLDDDHIMGLSETRSHFVVWSLNNGTLVYRIKPNFRGKFKDHVSPTLQRKKRHHTAKMLPWERRLESHTAKERRRQVDVDEHKERLENLKKEKENAIDMFLISEDHSIIVASFYAHHICVLDVAKQEHIQTLENYDSMMLLYIADLTPDGSYLVHANYDDESKLSYITLWHCRTGEVIRRIRNEKDVCAIAMNKSGTMVVFGKMNKELRVWKPHNRSNTISRIKGYTSLNFGVGSKICITENDTRAVVFAGDISLWNLEQETLLSVFTPDAKIQCCDVLMDGRIIVFGLKDSFEVISLKLRSQQKLDPAIADAETDDDDDDEDKKKESDEEDDED